MTDQYFQAPVTNGNPHEQALIRRWWNEQYNRLGELVWEYFIDGYYIDAVLFLESENSGVEQPGTKTNERFPLQGKEILICEAKLQLNPELIGQATVYSKLAKNRGAKIQSTVLFFKDANPKIIPVAEELGFKLFQHKA